MADDSKGGAPPNTRLNASSQPGIQKPAVDRAWAARWTFAPGVTYLNHGSFGPPPDAVRAARRRFQELADANPMDFLVRQLWPELRKARQALATFIDADPDDLVFCDNATTGMNIVAQSVALRHGDEVLLNDHEYGAVVRVWDRACRQAGARIVTADVPLPIGSHDDIADAIFAQASARTRLLVVSHIASPTGIIFPIEGICRRAQDRGIAVCIDGPHALAMLPVSIRSLGCDFYTASGHKWLSAPFGSGFLYVAKAHQTAAWPLVRSWGRPHPGREPRWQDEFDWPGTRDFSPWLSMPAAIEFLGEFGVERFRSQTHALARYARGKINAMTGLAPLTPDDASYFGSMAAMELPPGESEPLQKALWERHGIEVPIVAFGQRRLIRVSCHLYNDAEQIDRLVEAMRSLF